MNINGGIRFGTLVCLIAVTGCQQVSDSSVAEEQVTKVESQSDNLTSQIYAGQSFTLYQSQDSRPVTLLRSYLLKTKALMSAAMPHDRRSAEEILTDLKALSRPQLVGLRYYILDQGNWPKKAIDLIGELLPDGHREFLFRAVGKKEWRAKATQSLVELNDASVVGPILKGATYMNGASLAPIAYAKNPAFFAEAHRLHLEKPTEGTAFLMGCFGYKAEKEIRECMSIEEKYIRRSALSGLYRSKDKKALQLLLDIADFSKLPDISYTGRRFAMEGEKHVDTLITWLDKSPEEEEIAMYALAHISSEKGISKLLVRYEDRPNVRKYIWEATKSSPKAVREYVARRALNGTVQQKKFALAVAHQLKSSDRPEPGKEHPLLKVFLQASHDDDAEVRYETLHLLTSYAYDAHRPDGMKSLLRLIEMFDDPSAKVRGEAAVQASQYPCAEVLEIIKDMARNEDDERAQDTMVRVAKSMEERQRRLAGSGRTAVFLPKK